jgi:putative hydroxymethylpyrimidine transport system substrate-binding protein
MRRSLQLRPVIALVILAAATLLFSACGDDGTGPEAEKSGSTFKPTLGVSFAGHIGATNAGIRVAEERGYFKERGRDIWSGSPVGPGRPVAYVLHHTDEFGITELPQLVIAREEGAPVVAIGSLMPRATIAMIWLKGSGIRNVDDLEGKTIALPGLPFQEELLGAALKRAGLMRKDVEIKHVGYKLLPVLMSGRADAIFGASWNVEGAALEARGAEPVIKRAGALGIPNYDELVLFAREDTVAEQPDLIRDFMAAVARGFAVSVADPEVTAKLIKDSDEADPEATPATTKAEIEATLPMLSKTGYLDPGRVERLERWMHEEGMIRRQPPVSELLTNEYLQAP